MAGGLRDYGTGFPKLVAPASGLVRPPDSPGSSNPPGPDNFPVVPAEKMNAVDLLGEILKQVTYQNIARMPHIRSIAVDATGETLDWSMIGLMDSIVIQNLGPDTVFISFDIDGTATDNFAPSDLSVPLLANASINLTLCQFYKIGCRCAAGKTGLVFGIAFQAVAGNLGGGIS